MKKLETNEILHRLREMYVELDETLGITKNSFWSFEFNVPSPVSMAKRNFFIANRRGN